MPQRQVAASKARIAMTTERATPPAQEARLPTDDARQGETGHGVRYMLGIGIFLVVVAFGLVALFSMQPTGG